MLTAAEESPPLAPKAGEQVAQQFTLPASKSVWIQGQPGDITKLLGTIEPLDETKSETMRYWLFLPKDYDAQAAEKTWPVLLFLHGAGECGSDLNKVAVHGPPKLLKDAEYREKCPFIVVSPQCAEDQYWSPRQLLLLLDEIEKNYKVDKNRVYVTGLSMGGFGSWMLAAEAPKRFAAVAPICGGLSLEYVPKLLETPIWTFHGDKDSVVPAILSQNLFDAIEKEGGKKIKLTIYPGVDHDSWTQTYNNPELYKWFLDNVRKP